MFGGFLREEECVGYERVRLSFRWIEGFGVILFRRRRGRVWSMIGVRECV